MEKKINLQGYLSTINMPWGRLFYRLVWNHLCFSGMKILDFGSGFGITANHLALNNHVTAVEPNAEMVFNRVCENDYEQMAGSIELLRSMPDSSYDVIVCHNVFEYIDRWDETLNEMIRLLRTGGTLSIVKHHPVGKIMHKAVFENQIDEAMGLLAGSKAESVNFGTIKEYQNEELLNAVQGKMKLEHIYGLRMVYALQKNEFKYEADWENKLFQMECAIEEIPDFRNIAYFHHLIMKKN